MNIRLGDYKITSTSTDYTLYRLGMTDPEHRLSAGKAKEKVAIVGYYTTLQHALEAIPADAVKMSDAKDIKEVIAITETYVDLLKQSIKGGV